ncbi:MDR family MFS transporter [Bacillus gaemokensis]|uniref:MFS transporter n=1 Tax=Bacillus gaemokensis TaxID=574375 RepID=A0A073K9J2_9BACI|nr:MFS transporter [Bacillus gaemokensis]KEK23127.1 MFS transporter [Bacillus gaemokensis]KYG37534.1 MFS transporter [Bacillus gaemokensis]
MSFWSMHQNIKIRIITSFFTRTVYTMIFPFMAIYFSTTLGSSLAGTLLLINVCASIIVGLYGGYIADQLGRKKIMLVGQAMQFTGVVSMGICISPYVNSPWLTFCFMLVHSLGTGLMSPAIEAMLIDVSTPENRKMMYAINYWCINLSMAIGALLGGLLYEQYRTQLFITLSIVSALTFIMLALCIEEVYVAEKKVQQKNILKNIASSYKVVIKDRAYICFCLAFLCTLGLEFQVTNYIGIRLEQEFQTLQFTLWNGTTFDLTGIRMLSWISAENTLLIVLFSVLAVKIVKGFKEENVLFVGVFIFTLGFAIVGSSNNVWILLLAVFLYTIGEMMYAPVRQSILAAHVPENARSSYMAIGGLIFHGAGIMGALGVLLGSIIPSFGMSIVYFVIGVVGMLLFMKGVQLYKQKDANTENMVKSI